MRNSPLCRVALATALVLMTHCGQSQDKPLVALTPQEVWEGYDPAAEPLEISIERTWIEAGLAYRELRFTGMTQGESKVRVLAIFAAPVGRKDLPAVLHIHGGGQTASTLWSQQWGQRGYASLTFDFCGNWPGREKFTDWGALAQGNMATPGNKLMAVDPTPRESSWYLWARISRRAITALAAQEEVDHQRLGIFGVSVGGSLVWPVAAMDDRVKAACAIYGCGYTTYPVDMSEADPHANDPQMQGWRAAMEPESYAPLVRCPLLFLNSTNDHHGRMDPSFLTLAAVKSDCRWAYTPRYRHHILDEQGQALGLWMDTHLRGAGAWPAVPDAALDLSDDGVPMLHVSPDRIGEVDRVKCFYALENTNPINRFWRSAGVTQTDDHWSALLPIMDIDQPLFAFANVHYRSGVCQSTRLVTVVPARLGEVLATDQPSLVIDDFSQGIGDWVTTSTATDPVTPVPKLIRAATGPGDVPGITVSSPITLLTHKIGDPKWRGPEGAALEFKVFVEVAKTLKITLKEREMSPGQTEYSATRKLEPNAGWQSLKFELTDFRDEERQPLSSWRGLQCLELATTAAAGPDPVYTGFRWVK